MADWMQFASENRLNGCQICGRFRFLKTESEPNFGFLHIPTKNMNSLSSQDPTSGTYILLEWNRYWRTV